MVYLFLDCDEYLLAERLAELKAGLGDPELAAINMLELAGEKTSASDLLAHANMMPFLCERRLVIATGYLAHLDKRMAASKSPTGTVYGEAAYLLDGLAGMPDTCDLVFIEHELDKRRALWRGFSAGETAQKPERKLGGLEALVKAKTIVLATLETPDARALPGWIQQRARQKRLVVDGRAVQMLADFVGRDLRRLDNELEKLSLYADGRPISPEYVRLLVSDDSEEMIWNLTDGLSQRNGRAAMTALAELWRNEQQNPFGLLSSIARQYRLIIKVKTLMQQGMNNEFDIAKTIGEKPFPVKKAMQVSGRYGFAELDDIMERLLDANLAMTTGADQATEIDVLTAELTLR
jgi:DNA polymerase-3 subunit delta